jgi:hypothetical protein
MIYGGAQQSIENNGGMDLAKNFQEGAALALQVESNKQKQAAIEQQKAELENTKLSKLYDFIKDARNYNNASDRNNYLKNAIGLRNALDLPPEILPDDRILSFGSDENMGRIYTLQSEIEAGNMTLKEAGEVARDPQKMAQIRPTPLGAINLSKVDWSEAQQSFFKRQSEEKQAQIQASMKAGQQSIGNTTELRKELTSHPVTKESFTIKSSFDRINKAFGGKSSAAGDLSGIFSYMKMLDPGSTVREGEFANAQNAASVPDQIRNQYNKVMSGERLNPAQRADFLNRSKEIYNTQVQRQQELNNQYTEIAKSSGVNPKQVIGGSELKPAEGAINLSIDGVTKSYPKSQLEAYLKNKPKGKLAPLIKRALGEK